MTSGLAYPKPWGLLWICAAAALAYLLVALAGRWRGWARGAALPAIPSPDPGAVARIWIVEVFAQRQLLHLSRLRRAAHLGIFWGFTALALLSAAHVLLLLLEALALDRGLAAWFLRGEGRALAAWWGNGFGLLLLCGLLLALVRRLFPPPVPDPAAREADLPLVLALLALTLSGFLLEALRLLFAAGPQDLAALRLSLTALWTLHALGGVALVAWLPRSGLMHALLAPLVIALNARAEHARKDLYWPDTTRPRPH